MVPPTVADVVGQRVPSVTNRRMVLGRGRFVADLPATSAGHVVIVRSPHAHARITSVDIVAALAHPGVVDVVTGNEIQERTNPIPEGWDTSTIGANRVDWYALARDRVRYVGEAVAAVVAQTTHDAHAAATLVDVEYELLPAVSSAEAALADDAPLVEPEWGDNVLLEQRVTDGDVDAALQASDRVVRGEVASQRITGVPLEPRGILADYDPAEDLLTFWESTQQPHPVRAYLAEALAVPEGSIRVRAPHVGGAFGLKQPTSQEEVLLAYLARKHARPIRWIESRAESLQVGGHSRETACRYEAGIAGDGTITGVRIHLVADVGAPTAYLGWGMSLVTMFTLPSVYRVPAMDLSLRSVVTNKCPWTPYRGFGKDMATFVMERIMDHVAGSAEPRQRVATRLRNVLDPADLPHRRASGAMLDSGDYPAALNDVLELAGFEEFSAVQAAARADGRRIGMGIGYELTPEGVAIDGSLMNNGYDGATVRVSPTGDVTVLAGVTTPGTGNETALAQIAAQTLGCALARVHVVQGDTQVCPWGLGNYSSRSVIIGGSAVVRAATELRDRITRVAASMLDVVQSEVDTAEDWLHVRGDAARGISFDEVVRRIYWHAFEEHADLVEPALEATRYYRIDGIDHQPPEGDRPSLYPTWPYGAVACIVEVDPETGMVRVLRYCAVEDAGRIINPLLADAQLHGGIAQGLGGALYEQLSYDVDGQPLGGTLMDYTIPTAVELPTFEIAHRQTPSPFTPLGTKGVGESGLGGTLGALCAAVENAFPELDLRLERLPLSPNRVWRALREAQPRPGHVRDTYRSQPGVTARSRRAG